MRAHNLSQSKSISFSDKLINGLFSGILAGAVMLAFLLLAGLAIGEDPLQTLTYFSVPGQTTTPIASAFLHLGISAVYGSLFGIIIHFLPASLRSNRGKWISGLAFGLLLYLLASGVLLPATGSRLLEIPAAILAAAHALYGLFLGLRTNS